MSLNYSTKGLHTRQDQVHYFRGHGKDFWSQFLCYRQWLLCSLPFNRCQGFSSLRSEQVCVVVARLQSKSVKFALFFSIVELMLASVTDRTEINNFGSTWNLGIYCTVISTIPTWSRVKSNVIAAPNSVFPDDREWPCHIHFMCIDS